MRWEYILAAIFAAIAVAGIGGVIGNKRAGVAGSGRRMRGGRWANLPDRNRRLIIELIDRAKRAGLNVDFFDGWRSPETQRAKLGAGKLKDLFNSYHVWGEAFDIVFINAAGGWYWPIGVLTRSDGSQYINPMWEQLGRIGESLGLKWGGRWYNLTTKSGFFDGAHFQSALSMPQMRGMWATNTAGYLRQQGVPVLV